MKFSDHAVMSTAVQMLFSGCTASECVKKEAEVAEVGGGEVLGGGPNASAIPSAPQPTLIRGAIYSRGVKCSPATPIFVFTPIST